MYSGGNISHCACKHSKLNVVKWIIENSIINDINQRDNMSKTALHWLMDGLNDRKVTKMINVKRNENEIALTLTNNGLDDSIDNYASKTAEECLIDPTLYQQLVVDDELLLTLETHFVIIEFIELRNTNLTMIVVVQQQIVS